MKKNKNGGKTYLDISTAHLTQGTFGKLNSMDIPYTYNYDEGAFISVPDKEEVSIITMPDDLRILLQYAWDNDIDLIRMDRDAEVCDDLPVYEWSMENLQLAGRIWSCMSDRYDDEEYKLGTLPDIVAAIDGANTETLKDVLNKLCDRIKDMEEE